MKKSVLSIGGILIAAAVVFFYLIGLYHGRSGEGLTITKEAIAAQAKSSVSPVKASGLIKV